MIQLYHPFLPPSKASALADPQNYRFGLHLATFPDPQNSQKGAYMAAALPLKRPVKVGELVRRRLRELKRTPRELAEAVQVSEIYIADLVAGRRVPPAPGRMDVYAPMTKFLKLHRNDPRRVHVPREAHEADGVSGCDARGADPG